MKYLVILYAVFLNVLSFAQDVEPSEKAIKEHHIKEYKVINRKISKKKSELDNRVMKYRQYNKEGNLIMRSIIMPDIVYMKDSSIYKYDETGQLIETTSYDMDFPLGEEQLKTMKEFGDETIDTTITIYKYYYFNGNKVKTEEVNEGEVSQITSFIYDSLGRKILESGKFYSFPDENDYNESYQYGKDNKVIFEKCKYINTGKVIETEYTYDENSNLIKTEIKGGWNSGVKIYSYNEKRLLKEAHEEKRDIVTKYFYDEKGYLIEKKEYMGGKLYSWEKYKYNDKNLITDEFWLDEKTGKVTTSIGYEYKFY